MEKLKLADDVIISLNIDTDDEPIPFDDERSYITIHGQMVALELKLLQGHLTLNGKNDRVFEILLSKDEAKSLIKALKMQIKRLGR